MIWNLIALLECIRFVPTGRNMFVYISSEEHGVASVSLRNNHVESVAHRMCANKGRQISIHQLIELNISSTPPNRIIREAYLPTCYCNQRQVMYNYYNRFPIGIILWLISDHANLKSQGSDHHLINLWACNLVPQANDEYRLYIKSYPVLKLTLSIGLIGKRIDDLLSSLLRLHL